MNLKELMVDTKSVWLDFPGYEGFSVEVANQSRKELSALRKRCTVTKFDKKTRQYEQVLDEDKFVEEFSKAVIKNWKGLKLKYLTEILLVDISKSDPEKELDYSDENAQLLIANSTEFDNWVNEVVFDLSNFR